MKILFTLPALDGGGIDKILYDYSIRFPENIQCDFLVHTDYEGILERELKNKGYNIYHVPSLHENRKKYISDTKSIIKSGNYDIIHVNQGYRGLFFLYYAKKYGIKIRIVHSHMAYSPRTLKECVIKIITTNLVKKLATHLFACGNDAAKWMWGKKAFNNGKVYIMRNAINAEQFNFSLQKRERIRDEYNISDKFVIGNVARFSYQKNHELLINIFAEVKKIRTDAILMLIGRGELEDTVKAQVEELGLSDSVMFMGVRNDVPDLTNAMDVFALPSRFEGLPVTLVEIQANGLPAVISDNVTKEMAISKDFAFIPLNQSVEVWAKAIAEMRRDESKNLIENTIYDINVAAGELWSKYFDIVQGKDRLI